MIYLKERKNCCGCNACGDVCPKKSISFVVDVEGFLYPKINVETCIDCHLCEKVCPIINIEYLKHNDLEQSDCYAAINKNIEIRFDSTSGGVFSALAMGTYENKGFVGGAVFNDEFLVNQVISNNKKDLGALRSSKYLQSDAQGFYKKVRELVKAGEQVLVCGTPCQMAALRKFLCGDYDNIIFVDFICRGINSPKVFRRYLDYLEDKYESKVIYFKAKNKELGWRQLTSKVIFENGKVLYDTKDTSYFTTGYLQTGVYCRPSCYECKFKGFPRIADITIADFWGAEKVVGKEYDNDLGTSLVMLNSKKGKAYFEKIKGKLSFESIPFESILKGNPALTKPLNPPIVDRISFYEDLDSKSFLEVAEKYIVRNIDKKASKKVKIKNCIRFLKGLYRIAGWNITLWLKNLKYNFFVNQIQTNISEGRYLLIANHTILDIHHKAKIIIGGRVILGKKKFFKSNLETRILLEKDAIIDFKGNAILGYGSDIEVFQKATLSIGANFASNIDTTIICAENITIDNHVKVGRGCSIRDNNGDHYMSIRGYKNSRPVYIGQHSWLCEGCTLLAGTKLGTGVIVAAKSVVGMNAPSFSVVMGNPSNIIDENIYWKY